MTDHGSNHLKNCVHLLSIRGVFYCSPSLSLVADKIFPNNDNICDDIYLHTIRDVFFCSVSSSLAVDQISSNNDHICDMSFFLDECK